MLHQAIKVFEVEAFAQEKKKRVSARERESEKKRKNLSRIHHSLISALLVGKNVITQAPSGNNNTNSINNTSSNNINSSNIGRNTSNTRRNNTGWKKCNNTSSFWEQQF
jgi:hypothetical protein